MKRVLSVLLCILMLISLFVLPISAAIFQVSYYEEEIYAGGIMDLYAFPHDGGVEPFTYQWQYDVGIGDGHWYNLEDNDSYKGTKTNHLQLYTRTGAYEDWDQIPFRCEVTDAEGTTFYTPNIYMKIYPTDNLIPRMESWGYGLYTPSLTNVANLRTSDDSNYTAHAFAGSKIDIFCGNKPVEEKEVLRNSEVRLTREIYITENGHTTQTGDRTVYIPYTVGTNAVTVEIKLHLTIGEYDLGYLDQKTIRISTSKPTAASTVSTKTACSLLRYTYNESQKLASIPKGATVEILAKEGSYYQVFYGGYVGYIGASLLNVPTPSYDPIIKEVDVTVLEPAAGKKPSFVCNVLTQGCQLYHNEPVSWYDKTEKKFLRAADTFQEGHNYTLMIWLAAKSGYKFQVDISDQPDLAGTINGNRPPFINKAYEQNPEEVIELSYDFNNVRVKESERIRLSGKGRCETAYLAANELKLALGVNKFNAIVIASGDNFADALAGSYLAAVKKAPILLYRSGYADDNAKYIADNLAAGGRVYILGGTAAVPAEMETALSDYNVRRIKGANRFETNLAILREAGVGSKDILVATGYNFADSLSASATGMPILLVHNGTGLTDSQKTFLDELNGNNIVVIGGIGAVSEELYDELMAYGSSITRVKGFGREETSVAIAEKYFSAPEAAVLAYSRNFPDGLCGGPLAYAMGAPLLLTNTGYENVTASYTADMDIVDGYVLGGTAAVSDEIVRAVFSMAADDYITVRH